jgi:hypothetical protein
VNAADLMAKAKRALASAHKLLQDNDGDLQIRVSEKPIVEIVLLDAKEARPRLFSAHFYPDRSRQRKSDIRCAPPSEGSPRSRLLSLPGRNHAS